MEKATFRSRSIKRGKDEDGHWLVHLMMIISC